MNHPQPSRPQLAVSAAIFRDGRLLVVRRARAPANGLYTLPGGRVEMGETLTEAVKREVREETALEIEVLALAGYREIILKGDGVENGGAVTGHFVILPFAARWIGGEVVLNEELDDARWIVPAELTGLKTTEGLAGIVQMAAKMVEG